MEKLTVLVEDDVLVLDPEQTIELEEEFPKEIRSGYVEVLTELPKPVIDNHIRLAL